MNATGMRLVIDGRDVTGECAAADVELPRLTYRVPDDERSVTRVLGPQGFTITITDPGDALIALVNGGVAVHTVHFVAHGYSVTRPVQFHKQWTGADGAPRMFGCLASNPDNEAKWVQEAQLADAQRPTERV